MTKAEQKELATALEHLGNAKGIVESLLQSAQDRIEGKSDKWLESEKGEAAQAQLSALESAFEALENADAELSSVQELD